MTEASLKPGWRKWRFDQIATSVNDRIDNPSESDFEYYVGLEHIDPDSLKLRRWGSPSDVEATKLIFRKGDIIFGRRRVYQRKVAVAEFDGICSAHALVLRAKPEAILPELLPFFMQSDVFMERAKAISVGSLSPTINWKTLAQEEFPLPNLEEQERILILFDSLEKNITCNNEAEIKAVKLWKSLSFQEFSPNKCVEGSPLKKHYSIVSGQVDPKRSEFSILPLIAPNHIEGETGRLLDIETAAEQNAISGKYLYDPGAVLYSKIRPNLVKATIAPCRGLCSADMYALKPKNALNKEYLLELLLSDLFTQFAVSGSMRTGMPKLNRKQLELFNFRVPSIEEQESYLQNTLAVRTAWKEVSVRKNKLARLKTILSKEVWSEPI